MHVHSVSLSLPYLSNALAISLTSKIKDDKRNIFVNQRFKKEEESKMTKSPNIRKKNSKNNVSILRE